MVTASDPTTPTTVDPTELLRRASATLGDFGAPDASRQVAARGRDAFARRTGLRSAGQRPVLVVGREVALELGHPRTEAQAGVLVTQEPGRVRDGRVRLFGPDLGDWPRGSRLAFGQLVCVELDGGAPPDPFALEQAQLLTNRLPGWMVRAVPGRLWARVGETHLARGLSLLDVGEALVTVYSESFPAVRGVEVSLVTRSPAAVATLAPLVTEARVLSGQHKKLVLGADGELECSDLHCDQCEEREVCDALRDVIARRRRS